EYAKLPLVPPYLQPGNHQFGYGANFASAGAGVLDETLPGLVINLNTQMAYFKDVEKQLMHKLGDEEATRLLSKAVYFFSIGGNDYGSLANYSGSHDKFVEMVIGNMTVVIKEIYEQGGRNFGFLGVAAVGCLPAFRSANGHCNEELATLVKLHNEALHNMLHKLERQLKGFRYSYFDFYTVSLDLIDNPSIYGLKEGKSACCGSGPYRGINSCGGKRGIAEYKLCANATEYAKLPLIPPYLLPGNHQFGYGANFASAGAGALDETSPGLVINLNTQLTYLKDVEKQLMHTLGDEEATQFLSEAVYLFSIGSNDYGSLVNYSGSHNEYVEMVIGNMTVVIKEVYRQGGRNFGILGMAAVGSLPAFRNTSGDRMEELATLVKLHNEALHNMLHKLERQLKGFRCSYFDVYTVSLDLIDNPSKYGLKEGKSARCGSGPYRGINSCGGKRGIAEYKLCANATLISKPSVRLLTALFVNTQLEALREASTLSIASMYKLREASYHTLFKH
ncbi:hypothetical protein RJ639_021361, partial [Escallonia herrerae]